MDFESAVRHRSDVAILEKAGLTVQTAKYTGLFQMLLEERLDYFPRGAP